MTALLPVTLSAAAAAAILNIWLSIRIGAIRRAAESALATVAASRWSGGCALRLTSLKTRHSCWR